jgi:hypothetical protein
LPNVERKVLVSACSVGVGFVGYVAVMLCKRVQDERPRAATSGGQSVGYVVAGGATTGDLDVVAGFLPAMAKRDVRSLQVRHLPDR